MGEPGRKKERETVGQVAQAGDGHQHAQNPRQEGRLENQISRENAKESKEHQADTVAIVEKLEREQRQGVALTWLKGLQIVSATQNEHSGKVKEIVDALDGDRHQVKEHGEQSDIPVHRPEQYVQDQQ